MSTLPKRCYCLECSWSVNSEDYTRQERNSLIVEHAVETGHDIDCTVVHPALQLPDSPDLN